MSTLEEIESITASEKEKKRFVQSRQFRDAARVAKTIKSLSEQREKVTKDKAEEQKSIEITREEIENRQNDLNDVRRRRVS